jgi:hypothetical protein
MSFFAAVRVQGDDIRTLHRNTAQLERGIRRQMRILDASIILTSSHFGVVTA